MNIDFIFSEAKTTKAQEAMLLVAFVATDLEKHRIRLERTTLTQLRERYELAAKNTRKPYEASQARYKYNLALFDDAIAHGYLLDAVEHSSAAYDAAMRCANLTDCFNHHDTAVLWVARARYAQGHAVNARESHVQEVRESVENNKEGN